MKKIILASQSPRRKQLLKLIGLEFDIVVSNIEEKLNPRLKPKNQPAYLSKIKAMAVSEKFEDAIIIGADSMVLLGDKIIGKPKDEKDARKMLSDLSGKAHSIITGYTILDSKTKKVVTHSLETKIWFRKINKSEIAKYIAAEKPFDKAGAYAIQGLASIFVQKISGDYFSGVGLPLFNIARDLKKFGVYVL